MDLKKKSEASWDSLSDTEVPHAVGATQFCAQSRLWHRGQLIHSTVFAFISLGSVPGGVWIKFHISSMSNPPTEASEEVQAAL